MDETAFQKCVRLRREGKTYQQIADMTKIPRSTIRYWIKKHDGETALSQEIRRQVSEHASKTQASGASEEADARQETPSHEEDSSSA